ncbi:toprim domain-containing protein [Campylobacter hyointestinalis]|uniref:Toprim domain n=1 Tax=Campylobacter hyointestinalis subsp. hyointestinalis TaxID=91352 RepID=A0A855NGB9_CAMHY|nr:toprim domain-containing protein [Campylobacter hyointestinalis]PPB72798.1 hypothetical protein CDQ78_00005 [Campylobacter hyointestinalis subsp. hyointestinalis]TWO19289.1 DUF3991 domain-containing protein [Campylobacter hyointestinalis]CUU74802.1 Toprim domain [Campylobacter hyointestinalis subsp. hyointestinalis]CUU76182.1 Toprim domain [Campylobacter hyointestinalis]CUU78870.1 Toprim domain [Campylobacter hyointestinalis subsp. hyointestinalis]
MRNSKTNLLELPLDEILKNNGYYEKRNKSSRNYKTLTNDQDDTIIISRQANGHYLYFSPNNGSDRGNIYNFAKNRGVSVQNLIDENKINDIKELQNNIKKIINTNKNNNEIIDKFKKFDKIDKNSFLISKRKISSELLANFSSLKQDDKFKNAVVPTYTLGVVETNDGNREFLRQTGTISYLSKPLTQDPQGKAYDKPIKQLCNGAKGLEILKADGAHKSPKDFKNIVICESMIDALSYCELKRLNLKETLLCSTNGQISSSQKEVFKHLNEKATDANIILAFDNDKKGMEFNAIVKEIIPRAKTDKAILKDFNDDLVVGKALGLKADEISKENIAKPLNEFNKKVEYLSKKYDFLEPQAKNSKVKELFVCNISKFREIETKVKCLAGMRECYKRLDIICRKIEKDYSRQR